jgi:hypothetical protein
MYVHDARQAATGIYPLSSVLQRMGMVENSAVGAQFFYQDEVKSPRMAQTDKACSVGLLQALQEEQPLDDSPTR